MRNHTVFIRHENQAQQHVTVSAFGENDAVQKVSKMGLGGVIFAVRDQWSTMPAPV
jgi:hypothetical protein